MSSDTEVKLLMAAASEVIRTGNTDQAIRSTEHGSLHELHVDMDNPVSREYLEQRLPPEQFVHPAVAFLPRKSLDPNGNIFLHRVKATDDRHGIYGRLYSYAMLLLMNSARRGANLESWSYKAQNEEGKEEMFHVRRKRRNLVFLESVYNTAGELCGWYIFSYDVVPPVIERRAPAKATKRTRAALEKSIAKGVKKARKSLEDHGFNPNDPFEGLDEYQRVTVFTTIREAVADMTVEVQARVTEQLLLPALDDAPPAGAADNEIKDAAGDAEAEDADAEDAEAKKQEAYHFVHNTSVMSGIKTGPTYAKFRREVAQGSLYDWMERLFVGADFKVDTFESLWQAAHICPVNPDDLLSTIKTTMSFAYAQHDRPLVNGLNDIDTVTNQDDFASHNVLGPAAPRNLYSMQTAVLLKRRFAGPVRGEEGQALSVQGEIDLHYNVEGKGIICPSDPRHATILPFSIACPIDGLFRILLPDIAKIRRDLEARLLQIESSGLPLDEQFAARQALQTKTTTLRPWRAFTEHMYNTMAPFYNGERTASSGTVLTATRDHAFDFKAHYNPYTPGMGLLSAATKYFHTRNAQGKLFSKLRVPYGDEAGDKDLDIGLQYKRRNTARLTRLFNNRRNAHVIARIDLAITDSSRSNPSHAMGAILPTESLRGPPGTGKSHLMSCMRRTMPPGTSREIGHESEAVGHGEGDNYGLGGEFKDETKATDIGVDPANCNEAGVMKAALNSKGHHPNEMQGSRKYDRVKRVSTTGRDQLKVCYYTSEGVRKDMLIDTTSSIATFMAFNIPMGAFSGTNNERVPGVHVVNMAGDTVDFVPDDRAIEEACEESRDRMSVECFIQWLLNVLLLPPIPNQHVNDFCKALQRQLSWDNPEAGTFFNNRTWGRVKSCCRSLMVTRAVVLCGLTGAGRDDQGRVSVDHTVCDLRCMFFCPLSYAAFAAELYDVAGSPIFQDVVRALREIMGLVYNPRTRMCERDKDFWEVRDAHRRPSGNLTFEGDYAVRTGLYCLASRKGSGSGGNSDKDKNNKDKDKDQSAATQSYRSSAEASFELRLEQNSLCKLLAAMIASHLNNSYDYLDILYVLTSLRRNWCRNRSPGNDFERRASASAQKPMPGFEWTTEGFRVHQRVFDQFHPDYFYHVVQGMQAPQTAIGKGLRGRADDQGRFLVVDWCGPAHRTRNDRERDLALIQTELQQLEARKTALQQQGKQAARAATAGGGGRMAFASMHVAEEKKRRQEEGRQLTNEINTLKDAIRAVENGVAYQNWRNERGLPPLDVHMGGGATGVRDWGHIEDEARREYLQACSITDPKHHWTTKIAELQKTWGVLIDAARVVTNYVTQPIPPEAPMEGFLTILDKSTKAVADHARLVGTMTRSGLRPMGIAMARRIWGDLVVSRLMCPPIVYLLSVNADNDLPAEMAQQLFRLHRSRHKVHAKFREIQCLVQTEVATQGTTNTLVAMRNPRYPRHKETPAEPTLYEHVYAMAEELLSELRVAHEQINVIADAMAIERIPYEVTCDIIRSLECSSDVVECLASTPITMERLIKIIFKAADVPESTRVNACEIVAISTQRHHNLVLDLPALSHETTTTAAPMPMDTATVTTEDILQNNPPLSPLHELDEDEEPAPNGEPTLSSWSADAIATGHGEGVVWDDDADCGDGGEMDIDIDKHLEEERELDTHMSRLSMSQEQSIPEEMLGDDQ